MRLISLAIAMLFVLSACSVGSDDDATPDAPDATPTLELATPAAADPTVEADEEPTEADVEPTETEAAESTPTEDTSEQATSEPESTQTETAGSGELAALIDQIAEDTADARGLELLEEIDSEIINREQLGENLLQTIEEDFPREQADLDRDLLWMLRLIDDPELDYYQLTIDLLTEQVAGYYNTETDELFVVSEESDLSADQKVTMSHEIVHALQDQHFGLDPYDEDSTDFDGLTAFAALTEGDATWAMIQYAIQYLTQEEINEFVSGAGAQPASPTLDNAPRYIRDGLLFPYEAGFTFVEALINEGDIEAVNAAFENPPVSTEQILHPEKYISEPQDLPLEVDIPDLSEALGDGWEETYEGTLGEFDLNILLEENGVAPAGEATLGWGGTRFEMWGNGDALLTVMATRWDTEEDATEFDEALRETLSSYEQDGDIWFDGARYHALISMGDRVVLTTSTDRDALTSVQNAQQVNTP